MKNLAAAILEVMKKVTYVETTGRVAYGSTRYSYASEGDILSAFREPMVESGLILLPTGVYDQHNGEFEDKRGDHYNLFRGTFEYTLVHVPSGESMVVSAPGEGADKMDKAAYQAATGSVKYAIRRLFLVETGDDPEAANIPSEQPKQQKAQKKDPPKNQPTTAPAKVDIAALQRAKTYKIVADNPFKGKTLGDAAKDPALGVSVIANLAGKDPDGVGKMFEPGDNEELIKMGKAAEYIFAYDEDYQKLYKQYKASVN